DSLLLELGERLIQVVDAKSDVAVGRAHLVGATVVVERELELLDLPRRAEEVVGRLELPVTNDRKLAPELQSERLVEGPASVRVGGSIHRVEEAAHGRIICGPSQVAPAACDRRGCSDAGPGAPA